ncbi:MAG: MBL fold metallo-hydrolase [Nitrospira sp.]|nr:MBL fold metallo-hydrolase [Nitrospira sp.]
MRLRIYQSDKGDCLLVSGTVGGHILVDGGMRETFETHVRNDLGKLAKKNEALDLVYVSHIDQDHISGVLELLDNVMAWRVYEYRKQEGANVKAPKFPAMPAIKEIWHNAFSLLLKDNAGPVERLLAQSSLVFGLSSDLKLQQLAFEHHELAYSVREAIQVSQRVSAEQLNIPLNRQFDGQLIMSRSPAKRDARIGDMNIFVIGPLPSEVDHLCEEWNEWLRNNRDAIRKLKQEAEADARSIGNSAARIRELLAARVDELGVRKRVTTPNLASVMLMVVDGQKKVLLTGDGHYEDILKGLEHHRMFDANDNLHINALKVQHHGSENNYHLDMAQRVTADNYIFCGNGKHENPDTRVVKLICETHRKVRPGDTFTLWFNCAPDQAPKGQPQAHMKKVEKEVDAQIAASSGKIKAKFLNTSHFDLTI